MTRHEWHERDDDNQQIYYRANHHAGKWTFHSRPKNEEIWINYEVPPLTMLEAFREILWNKIQRRRAPEKFITDIDEMLEDLRATAAAAKEEV